MSKAKVARERSLLKGALAGLIGGIVGTGAKTLVERAFSPTGSAQATQPGTPIQQIAAQWTMAAVAGGVYGAAVEVQPTAAAWRGAGFGLALNKLNHQAFSPMAGQGAIRQQTQSRQAEWLAYAAFGLVTEATRSLVRRGL